MAEIKFYQDAAKTIQVYPEINPDGNHPGVTVGLADNLVSPDGINDTDTWQYRSTGGELDISDGYANLKKVIGSTISSTIQESLTTNLISSGITSASATTSTFRTAVSSTSGTYNFVYSPTISYSSDLVHSLNANTFGNTVSMTTGTYTFNYVASITRSDLGELISNFNQTIFLNKIESEVGTYTFIYDGTNWNLDSETVTLSQYGITTTGTEQENDTFSITYSGNAWTISGAVITMSQYGITTTGTEVVGDSIVINYTSNNWKLNNSTISLETYGIVINAGTPVLGDTIQIIYVAEQIGAIVTSNPTGLYSVGMNQFDKDGTQILSGYTIASDGSITAASGSYVIYFKCLGKEVYTFYNTTASSTVRVGYSATVPTTSSSVTVLSLVSFSEWADILVNNTYLQHYAAPADGYFCVATTDIENLCCHLTWEGLNEETYESYFDYTLNIPYTDKNGVVITTYGLVNLDNSSAYYDEIDFEEHKFYKRTTRIAYSAENLAVVQALDVPYLYDSNYIYYGVETTVYNLNEISSSYRMSDYGTEEFIGSSLALTARIFYQNNLRNKLMYSCEVIDNKVTSVNSSSTDTEYPSAKCVYDLDIALRHILGLDVNTFSTTKTYAVGEYVVYNLKLWKCTTAVTSAGA